MNGLALRERRLIAVALLLALVAVAWLGIVRPVTGGFADRAEQRANLLDDYARNARVIRSYRRLRAEAQAQARSASAFEIAAASPAAAGEAARDRLGRDLAASGASVHAVREQTSSAGTVRLRADFQIGLAGLTTLLRAVHDQAPSGRVDGLSIAADAAAAPGRPSTLEVRLDVSFAYAAPV
jgi:hypothetical protein